MAIELVLKAWDSNTFIHRSRQTLQQTQILMTTYSDKQYEIMSPDVNPDFTGYGIDGYGENEQESSGPYSLGSSVVAQASTISSARTAQAPSVSFSQSAIGIVFPTIALGLIFFYWYKHKRRIQKRETYSSIGGRSSIMQRQRNSYSDRHLLRHRHRSGDILDDEEDDDDPLARYANYHRLPKGAARLSLRRSSMGSPKHPALERIPTFPIRLETMKLLRVVGCRMVAHGIQSQPRRVWISINDDALVWQSEFKTKLPNNIGASSLLSVRGPVHNIAWGDIKFIDVGKNTESLKRAESVPENMCWSILTLNGSLDLQAKSQLERDSMVSCMVSMLDEYNDGEDWRAHYYNTYGNPPSTPAEESKNESKPTRGGAAGTNTSIRAPSIMTSYSLMSNDSLPVPVDV